MKQITLHDVHRATEADIKGWMPFEIISDGEVVALVSDVHILEGKPEANPDVHRLRELPFSKTRQAGGKMR